MEIIVRVMNKLGMIVWEECCLCIGRRHITQNPIDYFSENVVPIGSKTFRRRLANGGWLHDELLTLQQELDSERLQKAIDEQYKEARRARREHDSR